MSGASSLTVSGLSYTYPGSGVPTFQDLSFTVQSGRTLGIRGLNGCGKSTLLKVVASILTPSAGQIQFNQKSIFEQLPHYRNRVVYSAGAPLGLYPRLTAVENLLFFSGIKGFPLSNAEIHKLLDRVGFASSARSKKYFQYSLGMRQRMHLAKILLEPSEVVIVDEPTNGLDVEGVSLAINLFKNDLARKIKLVVSHDDNFLKEISDEIFDFSTQKREKKT